MHENPGLARYKIFLTGVAYCMHGRCYIRCGVGTVGWGGEVDQCERIGSRHSTRVTLI